MLRRVFAASVLCVFLASTAAAESDPRPSRWCGWWLRQELHVADKRFNVAAQWRNYGTRADGPAIGVVIVWNHHVGVITDGSPGHWIVKSGNDGGRVRERERSVAGAIAFRWPSFAFAGVQ